MVSTTGPSGDDASTGDLRFRDPYERLRAARDRAAALRDLTDAEVVQALAAASDEGDPLLANVLATEAENRMQRAGAVAAHAPEGIVGIAPDGRVTYANAAALNLLHAARDQVLGACLWELLPMLDEGGREVPLGRRPSFRALRETREVRGDARLRRPDGTTLEASYWAAPVLREDVPLGAVVVFRERPEGAPGPA